MKKTYYIYPYLEKIRKKLLSNESSMIISDFGAGSHVLKTQRRKISDIASVSLSDNTSCRILFQTVEYFQCRNILELGTSLGLSSLYLAAPSKKTYVTTLEGDPNIAKFAKDLHSEFHTFNIHIIQGTFDKTLPLYLKNAKQIDLAFIDGHHDKDATIDYFNQLLIKCHNESILIVDDIYWSEGMTQAWKQISSHPKVTLVLDLYIMGIIFLNTELSKAYFRYIPFRYKPWKIGLFG